MKTKKTFILLFLIFLILFNINFSLASETTNTEPSVSAASALLIDNKTNQILYKKNEDQKMYPASITKIMTAIIVLENCNLDDVVTASYNAIMSVPEGYTLAKIQIGEQLSVEHLLELLLLHSANDSANVLAEHVGGSIDSFVSMMNTKLNELGLKNSHFTNPYGLHDENHFSTASDLALLFKYCLKNETFRRISGQASCAIPATNLYGTRSYNTTNELLIPGSSNYYKYLTTGKTGYTSQSKECLVSSGFKDDLELICVVLGSENRFLDTRTIYEYGYSNYSIKDIVTANNIITNIEVSNATKDTKNLNLLASNSISILLGNSASNEEINTKIILNDIISAPIEQGEILGIAKYSINGVEYSTNLVAANNVEPLNFLNYLLYASGIFLLLLVGFEIFLLFRKKQN